MRLRRPAFPVKKCDALNTIATVAMRSPWLLIARILAGIFVASALVTVGLDHAVTATGTPAAARTLRAGGAVAGAGTLAVMAMAVS